MSSRINQYEPVIRPQGIDIARFVPVDHALAEAMLEHERRPFPLHLVMNPDTVIVGVWHRTPLLQALFRLPGSITQ
jgi:hypothetical protein